MAKLSAEMQAHVRALVDAACRCIDSLEVVAYDHAPIPENVSQALARTVKNTRTAIANVRAQLHTTVEGIMPENSRGDAVGAFLLGLVSAGLTEGARCKYYKIVDAQASPAGGVLQAQLDLGTDGTVTYEITVKEITHAGV